MAPRQAGPIAAGLTALFLAYNQSWVSSLLAEGLAAVAAIEAAGDAAGEQAEQEENDAQKEPAPHKPAKDRPGKSPVKMPPGEEEPKKKAPAGKKAKKEPSLAVATRVPSLAASNFKPLYDAAKVQIEKEQWTNGDMSEFKQTENQQKLFRAVKTIIVAFAKAEANNLHEHEVDTYFENTLKIVSGKKQGKGKKDANLKEKAVRLWTSSKGLRVRPDWQPELCSMVNAMLRYDEEGEGLESAAIFCAILNEFLVVRDGLPWSKLPWETRNESYRGTGIPRKGLSFFKEGLEYRTNMFLATSLKKEKAEEFIALYYENYQKATPKRDPVLFIVHFLGKCRHVNYIESKMSEVKGENEFLFPPYSAFKVLTVELQTVPTDNTPHIIHLEAFVENKEELPGGAREDLPLSSWH